MIRYHSLSLLIYLPLILFSWQSSSCRSSNVNAINNSTMNANRASNAGQGRDVRGLWGGQHISMEVSDAGAEIEYDCAHGRITEKIVPDRNGKFTAKGVHLREHPGPVRKGENSEQPASYQGSIDGDTMTLTVTLTQSKEMVGTFTLTHGKGGRVFKCK
jgi:hypothetical protein